MLLEKQIQQDMVAAMKSQDKEKLAVLRMVITAIKNEKSKIGNIHEDIADDKVIAVLMNQVKQRKDAAGKYTEAGRPDLAERELAEIKFIQAYLPEMLSADKVAEIVVKVAEQVGASSQADFGKLMGVVMKELKGKAEGEVVKTEVENYFAGGQKKNSEIEEEELEETNGAGSGDDKDWKDQYLRLVAEFDNFRKRTQKEKEDLAKYANQKVFLELVPILTNFERAFEGMEQSQDLNSTIEGLQLVKKELEKVFTNNKVEKIDQIGEKFDPNLHEVLMQAEGDKDEVLQIVEVGYQMEGKVIKVAKVIVGKG